MFANIEIKDIENFPKKLDDLLKTQKQNIQNLIDNPSNEFDTILKPMQEMDEELGLFFTPLSHLNSVLNSKETQKAYEESLPLLSKFGTEISQNKELYLKIKSLKAYDEESTKVIQNHLQDFHLSGVDLDEESKKRLEEISMRLSQLSNEFSQNLLDGTNEYELIVTDFEDVKDKARVVGLDEIEAEDWTLNISRYVLPPIGEDIPPLDEAIADFKEALSRVRDAEEQLREVMQSGGWLDK
jgi:oligopeptidase A